MMRLKPLTRFDPDNIKEWHKVNIDKVQREIQKDLNMIKRFINEICEQ